VSDSKLNILR